MNQSELRLRTRRFASRIVRAVSAMPQRHRVADVLGKQLLRSGTSVGANYREACRASSRRHFVTTMEIVQRELDETAYWLELIDEQRFFSDGRLDDLRHECDELLSIITVTITSTKRRDVASHQKSEIRDQK